jgi:hypothetical protein
VAAVAATQTEGTSSAVESQRALAGHVFQISDELTGPFVVTAFGTSTSIGVGNVDAGSLQILGLELGNRSYPLVAFGQGFDFSLGLTPDIGVRVFAGGVAYTGTSARGALVVGTVASYDLHATVTLAHTFDKQVRGALLLEGGERPNFSLLVVNAVSSAIQSGDLSGASALQSSSTVYFAPGASGAVAFNPAFGLIGEARYLWTKTTDGTTAVRQGIILAATADLDLDPLTHFPLGIEAVTRLETRFNDNGVRKSFDLGGGVFYTRRVRLQLGLEVVYRSGELRRDAIPSLDLSSAIATILLRYYW